MIDVGTIYRSNLVVRDDQGDLSDPDTYAFTVTLPDFTTNTTTPIVRDSLGNYHADYTVAQAGLFKFAWATTGPDASKIDYENAIEYRSVIGLAEARNYLHLSDTSQDELLRQLMMMATELAETIVGTCVAKMISGERIVGSTRDSIRLPSAPVIPLTDVTITSVWSGGPSWVNDDSTTQLIINYEDGVVDAVDMQGFWYGPWNATYTAGRVYIAQPIILSVKEIIADLFANHRGELTDPLYPNQEQEADIMSSLPANYEMPPQSRQRLERYALPGFA